MTSVQVGWVIGLTALIVVLLIFLLSEYIEGKHKENMRRIDRANDRLDKQMEIETKQRYEDRQKRDKEHYEALKREIK